ncbi:hypothetical protein K503DRAFT_774665 [Rhizopogon vinicolor AM-OR11-026]|uniref:Secreted protein n=1 Tax=Rhizopogon vinicolor AM-OR11-026 TaxID=1314800 RepID=A0A1B7MP07_9AGAM|nr:hypothetical protein K503DRAFT_774665 [Rhizopogon vinicolor AM-OR11-026]
MRVYLLPWALLPLLPSSGLCGSGKDFIGVMHAQRSDFFDIPSGTLLASLDLHQFVSSGRNCDHMALSRASRGVRRGCDTTKFSKRRTQHHSKD